MSDALQTTLNATKGVYGNYKVERCRPKNEGDAYEETAIENLKRKGRRVDVCEIAVTNQEGKLIARATGTAIPMT